MQAIAFNEVCCYSNTLTLQVKHMTYLKQNILASGLLILSLGTSVGLGYVMNTNETKTEINKKCLEIKISTPKFQFNHSIKMLAPQLVK